MSPADPRGYDGVAVTVPVSLPYTRYSEHGAAWFLGRCLAELVDAAGLDKRNIDGLAASAFTLAPDTSVALTEHFGLAPRWLDWLPVGGACGPVALRRAARAVQAGDAEIVACIAGDTHQQGDFAELASGFSSFAIDAVHPYGAAGPNAVFAMLTRAYMDRYGAARTDFGRLCIAQRENARRYRHALLREPLGMDDYLDARPVAEPLHLYDCVMPCAGAEGLLVMAEERAQALGLPFARIRGAIERHNAYSEDSVALTGPWAMDAEQLYAQAGLGPEDIDILQTYDDYPVVSFLQMEALGFCAPGKAARLVFERDLRADTPGLVHNSSGGQLSCGQAGAAGGMLGLVEAVRQVTGGALDNPVSGARTALVSGYGIVNYDRCLSSAAVVLESAL